MDLSKSSHVSDSNVNHGNVSTPNTERSGDDLPPWIEHSDLRTASTASLLLYALCGGRGERHLHDPLTAYAERVAADLRAFVVQAEPAIDEQATADSLQNLSERLDVLAILIGRAAHRAGLDAAA